MNLYRLDFFDPESETTCEGVPDRIGQQFLSRHMTTARTWAREKAAETNRAILVTRIAGAGSMKRTLVIMPDGSGKRPPGTRASSGPECVAGTGRTCFCQNCRAARR